MGNPTVSPWAAAAKAIRRELKEAFPGVSFSVKSEAYSMGTSVNVYWTGGPEHKQVHNIIDKYQYGHFDGMVDCYEYSNRRDDLPQVKFVFAKRSRE